MRTEYKVVPAPERAAKQRGLKGAALFAHSVEELMNELAADGWHYLRADTLPQEERSGLTNKTTTYRNLLVFQRVVTEAAPQPVPETKPAMDPAPEDRPPSDPDDEVTNLWHPSEDPETPLIADRQGQRVDL